MIKKHQFSHNDVRIESSKTLFSGFFEIAELVVRHKLFNGSWSQPIKREIFQRGEAVGVLLFDPANQLVGLVEQFRVGALGEPQGPWQFEVVAGIIEQGESPIDVACRELKEEAGLSAKELIPICDYLVSAGGTDEKMHLYCGLTNLQNKQGIFGLQSENEDILLHVWSYQDTIEAKAAGILNSAAVTIALQWLEVHHINLQDRC